MFNLVVNVDMFEIACIGQWVLLLKGLMIHLVTTGLGNQLKMKGNQHSEPKVGINFLLSIIAITSVL